MLRVAFVAALLAVVQGRTTSTETPFGWMQYCDEGDSSSCSNSTDVCGENDVCTSPCSSDDECSTVYGKSCEVDTGLCVYRSCDSDAFCQNSTLTTDEYQICDMSDYFSWSCTESCASPTADACDKYDAGAYCNETSGVCQKDYCSDDSECGDDKVCQYSAYCVDSCLSQNATYCAILIGDPDSRCAVNGTCVVNYCDGDDDDVCPDGTACNGDKCVLACAEDSECADRYGDSSYVCGDDSGACVYRECSADDECGDGYYCEMEDTSWYCNEGCATSGCYGSDEYDCTDACQSDGRCDCTYLGCLADDTACDDEGWKTECQDDGECGFPEDDCAVDDDCEDSQVCQYVPDFDAGYEAYEKRFCGDSCVGQDDVYDEWDDDSVSYCEAYFDYANCDADTGTCYTCRSSDDCTDDSSPTCYLGTNGNGCYLGCDTDEDCDADLVCQYSPQAGLYYCGEEGEQTPQPTMDTTMSPTMDTMDTTTMEPSTDPTMEPTEETIDNNSGAVRHGVVMVAMTGLMWWM